MPDIETEEYEGPERRRRMHPHPPRFSDAIHLSPQFALGVVLAIVTLAGFFYGMRGDVNMNADGVKRNSIAIQYEASERKAADSLAMDRSTRSEEESRREFQRMSDKMDEIKDLIIAQAERKAGGK